MIRDGSLTYVDEGPFRPLELTRIELLAENIRNVKSDPNVYPSPIQIQAVVFEKGKLRADGHADLLAEPHATLKSETIASGKCRSRILQTDRRALQYHRAAGQFIRIRQRRIRHRQPAH